MTYKYFSSRLKCVWRGGGGGAGGKGRVILVFVDGSRTEMRRRPLAQVSSLLCHIILNNSRI